MTQGIDAVDGQALAMLFAILAGGRDGRVALSLGGYSGERGATHALGLATTHTDVFAARATRMMAK